jgi:acyl-CoA thioesterase-2
MSQALQDLLAILDLEPLEHNLFRGNSPKTSWQRVFGGQVVGQALVAAQRTVAPDRFVHSLHCYFMVGGDPSIPIIYEVERMRDGKSFSTRRVVAIQHGQTIFSLEASFHRDEPGLDHQFDMPPLVLPDMAEEKVRRIAEGAIRLPQALRQLWEREHPFLMLPVELDHYLGSRKLPPFQNVWVRMNGRVPDDRPLQSAILAYLSDLTLLDTSTFPHGVNLFDSAVQAASLDHAIWFHRRPLLDDWLLYTQDSPSSSGSRGFNRGAIYGRDGTLVASVAQEGLVRIRRDQ